MYGLSAKRWRLGWWRQVAGSRAREWQCCWEGISEDEVIFKGTALVKECAVIGGWLTSTHKPLSSWQLMTAEHITAWTNAMLNLGVNRVLCTCHTFVYLVVYLQHICLFRLGCGINQRCCLNFLVFIFFLHVFSLVAVCWALRATASQCNLGNCHHACSCREKMVFSLDTQDNISSWQWRRDRHLSLKCCYNNRATRSD